MKNGVFLDEQEISLNLSKDAIAKLFDKEKDETFCNNLNSSLGDILLGKESEFYADNKEDIDNNFDKIENAVKELTRPYREHLNKYFLSENLNFFISNGCSIYAGSKAINQSGSDYVSILENIRAREFNKNIRSKIETLKGLKPEQILDQLSQIQSYLSNVENNAKYANRVENLISLVKKQFLDNCVIPIDYLQNEYHKLLLKKIISRPSTLNKVNIFTINYDLLIEKTAEELEIVVNNGFVGFHNRTFLPSAFKLGLFTKDSAISKQFPRSINLFKLHGSISWRLNLESRNNPYGIEEVQVIDHKIDNSNALPDCIIYPLQHKKRYSLDLPYSELLRQFIENLHKPISVLIIMGYSFIDEHINDLILNALLSPDFHLIVFSHQEKSELSQDQLFLSKLIDRSKTDSRITIFTGRLLGSFENIVNYLMAYVEGKDFQAIRQDTVKDIRDGIQKK
ncbi:MAG: SIR2 family protein [Nitrospirae bacterium]|nr:SIR2 family protein [Nitrospirota bacterium]